ncbi:hypothetical protein A2U01_0060297, partial [Trifolium medium]|nr:hypothetical protein [Trifolium medium]
MGKETMTWHFLIGHWDFSHVLPFILKRIRPIYSKVKTCLNVFKSGPAVGSKGSDLRAASRTMDQHH